MAAACEPQPGRVSAERPGLTRGGWCGPSGSARRCMLWPSR